MADINNEEFTFAEQIDRFLSHDKQSQELYDSFKSVFDLHITKAKNTIAFGGGLRDLSEAAKSLSSIRGDGIAATNAAFNAKMKIMEFKLKKQQTEKDSDNLSDAASLMRDLTESLHKHKATTPITPVKVSYSDVDSSAKLKERIAADVNSGALKLTSNEKVMKFDFSGVSYAFNTATQSIVVLDKDGNIIDNYPQERIPEDCRVKNIIDGIPIDNCGREIKQI